MAQSIGSVTLEMLTGSHPYPNLSQMQALFRVRPLSAHETPLTSEQIGSPAPSPEVPTDISSDAQQFLAKTFLTCVCLLVAWHLFVATDRTMHRNHLERPSAAELLEHAFTRDKLQVGNDPAQTPTTSTFSHDRTALPREGLAVA